MNNSIFYDDNKRVYVLLFEGNQIEMRLCEFLALSNRLKQFSFDALLNDLSDDVDQNRFFFHKNKIELNLNLVQLIRLHAIISSSVFEMKLKDMLYACNVELACEEEVYA
ncbi:MAG: hypothetical protein U0U66_11575 [Cytophagaceae bacterium]